MLQLEWRWCTRSLTWGFITGNLLLRIKVFFWISVYKYRRNKCSRGLLFVGFTGSCLPTYYFTNHTNIWRYHKSLVFLTSYSYLFTLFYLFIFLFTSLTFFGPQLFFFFFFGGDTKVNLYKGPYILLHITVRTTQMDPVPSPFPSIRSMMSWL